MEDKSKIERIMKLIEIWYYFKSTKLFWPSVQAFIEARINDELPNVPDWHSTDDAGGAKG